MDFLVVGPGAMGCLFASRLKMAGHGVVLLDYLKERAERLSRQGIAVEGVTGNYTVSVPTVTEGITQPPDVALVCVKSVNTRKAAEKIAPLIGAESRVLTLQNGIGNVEILTEVLGKEKVLGGVTSEGATLLEPGRIRHAGKGQTVVGPSGSSGGRVEAIVSAFNEAGFETRSAEEIDSLLWAKLIVNVGINALTAITGLKNGRLPRISGTLKVMQDAVEEAVAVARVKGIRLPYPDPVGRVVEVCEATSENIASMLQDVLNRRVTEVAFINGAVVREADSLGVPAPVNRTLTALVEAIQETYDERVQKRER